MCAVNKLVTDTGFFTPEEQDIAVELVETRLLEGLASGYYFIFADAPQSSSQLMAYSCYGPTPDTTSDFDLYWIAVSPKYQGQGLGRKLLLTTESFAVAEGATQLVLETSSSDKYTPTHKFYESLGYRQSASVENYYAPGDAKIVYNRQLLAPR
ncbi:MAG: ribosomal protein S18 acetylase RimI-like enzyme [Candidatus Azotimanducaceae bacterium]